MRIQPRAPLSLPRALPFALTLALSLAFTPAFAPAAHAQAAVPSPQAGRDFYSPSNSLLEIAKPIRVGVDRFGARLDAIRAGSPGTAALPGTAASPKTAGREPLGLVLSGGSARAYAHIGALRVLEAEGIVPDFLVANSMGAIIAGLYAAGCSPDAMERLFTRFPPEALFDPVLPTRGGLLSADRFAALLRVLVGDLDLGELPIPILVTAEDLESRRRAYLASGDFATALTASTALPVIFEPVRIGGMTLIDGGIANLVPVALAAEFSNAVIVSVALSDRPQDFSNPITIVNRAIDIGKTRAALEDLSASGFPIIRNDVESMSFMAFADPAPAIARGEASAGAAMPSILAALPPERRGGGFSPALAEARRRMDARLESKAAEVARGVIPPVRTSLAWKLGLRWMDEVEGSPLGLDGDRFAGVGAAFASGRLRADLSALAGFPGTGESWRASAGFTFQPLDAVLFSAEAHVAGSDWSFSGTPPAFAGAAADLRWSSGASRWSSGIGSVAILPRANFVIDWAAATGSSEWRGRADVEARFSEALSVSAGAFVDNSGAVGPEWTLKASHAVRGAGRISARSMGRYDLSAAGTGTGTGTGAWPGDAFRGVQTPGKTALRTVANFEIAWDAGMLGFDIAESFAVRSIEIGPYADLEWAYGPSWAGLAPSAGAAGAVVSGTLSLAGLTPFEISAHAGMGFDGSPVFGIRAGRLFHHAERQ